ncbi:MAG: hypothetical protein KGM18_00630 [Sphingomonadales bacterium]|nr:hypothetical protein [Sphingomonadales bacterium]
MSIKYTGYRAEAVFGLSVRGVGDSYDNDSAEKIIGFHKARWSLARNYGDRLTS